MTRLAQAAGAPPTRTSPLVSSAARVRMADTDAAGLIYYACVYRWAEVLFTDWLASVDRPLASSLDNGVGFPVVRSEASYLQPLALDDKIDLQLWPERVGQHSFCLLTRIFRLPERTEAVQIRVSHVYAELRRDRASAASVVVRPLPDWLVAALS